MYKPVQPIRCPKCGTTVNVNTSMILTTNPPCYEWTCPNCGEKGHTKQGDIITFENQTGRKTYQNIPYCVLGALRRPRVSILREV